MGYALFGEDPKVTAVLSELQATEHWPFDVVTDTKFVADLMSQFPTLDLPEEVRKYRAWLYDYDGKRKVRHRARFRQWSKIAAGRSGSSGRRVGGARRSGATPATAAEHGPTSDRLDVW